MTDTHLPGDFAVVSMGGAGGRAISIGEWAAGDGFTPWDHAFIYLGDGKILQAEPGGSDIADLGSYGHMVWSSGLIPLTDEERAQVPALARAMKGIPYSWLDYAAIAAHHLHIPAPGLKKFIETEKHEICSQLVDTFMLHLGVHLFSDGRWPGYVMPSDLGNLLTKGTK